MKKLSIIQSNYIPWKGYFDIISNSHEFILYDEAQFTKNDWRNRNVIKTKSGTQWITIPVYHKALHQKISETKVSDVRWGIKNWKTIQTNYGRAPHFRFFAPELEEFHRTFQSPFLSEINAGLIKLICKKLNIQTVISNAADFELVGDPTEKLVRLCLQTNSDVYVSGPAAKSYLNEGLFSQNGVTVEWMDYSGYREYPQLHPPFEHHVSIIDLLFNVGPDSVNYMKYTYHET